MVDVHLSGGVGRVSFQRTLPTPVSPRLSTGKVDPPSVPYAGRRGGCGRAAGDCCLAEDGPFVRVSIPGALLNVC